MLATNVCACQRKINKFAWSFLLVIKYNIKYLLALLVGLPYCRNTAMTMYNKTKSDGKRKKREEKKDL